MWQYKLIVSSPKKGIEEFENTVAEYLNAGWNLAGGAFIDSKLGFIFQPVVKYEITWSEYVKDKSKNKQ